MNRVSFPWVLVLVLDAGFLVGHILGLCLAVIGLGLLYVMRQIVYGRSDLVLAGLSARCLTDLAAWLSGRDRSVWREEWLAHLAGESGHDQGAWPKVMQALGFVVSAVRCRLADAAELAWRLADAVLRSRSKSNWFVCVPVMALLVAIVHRDGWFGLVVDDQEVGELVGFLYGVIRIGRWWRGVKPPEPKTRSVKE